MIYCNNISYAYQDDEYILKNISFNIPQGTFCFLTGNSGAGKSTLLNLLSMKTNPINGRIELFGKDTGKLDRSRRVFMRRRFGMIFQDFKLFEHLTVEENVALPLKVLGVDRKTIKRNVKELISWVGLKEYLKAHPSVLSGGQKQRIAIARAVINRPDIILADEPTGNLDPELSLKSMYLFEQLNKDGTTVILATHDYHLIENSKHSVMKLDNKKISFER